MEKSFDQFIEENYVYENYTEAELVVPEGVDESNLVGEPHKLYWDEDSNSYTVTTDTGHTLSVVGAAYFKGIDPENYPRYLYTMVIEGAHKDPDFSTYPSNDDRVVCIKRESSSPYTSDIPAYAVSTRDGESKNLVFRKKIRLVRKDQQNPKPKPSVHSSFLKK